MPNRPKAPTGTHKQPSRSWKQTDEHRRVARLLGQNVRRHRLSLGLTLEQTAEIGDLEVSQLAKLERGSLNPTLATLTRLAAGLGTPLAALFEPAEETFKR
ncbi:MAG: helix-turn-helix transcriptional regulator [Deltaproteobacteria bacterium]